MIDIVKVTEFYLPEAGWHNITGGTGAQQEVIREWAIEHGYEDIRGFNRVLSMMEWDYYDILKIAYKR